MEKTILHVEDNADDIMLVGLAFRKSGSGVRLEVATDGTRAMEILQNGMNAQPPACVLMDIKLPSMSGLELLGWIRSQARLRFLPVIMLTSSALPTDINQAYEMGANSYLVKPADLNALIELAKTIDQYWLQTNTGPVISA